MGFVFTTNFDSIEIIGYVQNFVFVEMDGSKENYVTLKNLDCTMKFVLC